ncbi:MAG: hypothetical protein HQL90_04230 [Magnetococcales bacterium]|nr:hypothetical protein [Magnetococcales bacterium]
MSEEEQQQQESQIDPEEAAARQDGWLPKDQFKGPPERWVDPATFNARGRQIAGIMEKKLALTREELVRQTAKMAELAETMAAFKAHHEQTMERQRREHELQIQRLKEQKARADRDGDLDGYKAAEHELNNLESVKPPEPPKAQPKTEPVPAEVIAFKDRNRWFDSDPDLRVDAIAYSTRLEREQPHLTLAENLAKTEAAIKRLNPDKFTNPKRSQDQAVESGSIPSVSAGQKRDYHSLPSSAKAACDSFVKQGLLTKEQYVEQYYGSMESKR